MFVLGNFLGETKQRRPKKVDLTRFDMYDVIKLHSYLHTSFALYSDDRIPETAHDSLFFKCPSL